MPKSIRHACRFLAGNDKIAAYLDAIKRSTKLLRDVQRALPEPLDEHCLHASLDSGILTLVTDSPVWSARLRFFAPELERALGTHSSPIVSCRVRVQPQSAAPSPSSSRAPRHKLSRSTANHLIEAAKGIEDAELAAALRRLARIGARSD